VRNTYTVVIDPILAVYLSTKLLVIFQKQTWLTKPDLLEVTSLAAFGPKELQIFDGAAPMVIGSYFYEMMKATPATTTQLIKDESW